jgi:hypothetical protein
MTLHDAIYPLSRIVRVKSPAKGVMTLDASCLSSGSLVGALFSQQRQLSPGEPDESRGGASC